MHVFALQSLPAILMDNQSGGFANAMESRSNGIENCR